MSNESENKRIDLTGFEGFTRDEWSQNGWHIGPNLIAELKRCYEEIDDLKRQYQSCNEALIETTNWNVRMVEAIDSGKMSAIKRVRNS
tara:strand:+ start:61 stop:324 length:264 start_codon:yes stop_codon:yes gene_type:complete